MAEAGLLQESEMEEGALPSPREDCGLAREETDSTRASARQKASAEISEVPSTRPSREASGASVDHLPKAELSPRPAPPPKQRGRGFAAAAALLALAACTAAAVYLPRPVEVFNASSSATPPQEKGAPAHGDSDRAPVDSSGPISAWALLESRELQEVATENLMSVGRRVLTASDRDIVHATVSAGFRNMSTRLRQRAPKAAKVLDAVRFNEAQRHAVSKTLRLLSDPRVQSIGFDVAKAIRESASKDHWAILDRIHRRLRPRVGEIRTLRDQLIPSSLWALTQVGHHWDLTLTPENLRAMQDVSDAWALELGVGASGVVAPNPAEMLSIFRKLGAASTPPSDNEKTSSSHINGVAGGLAAGVSEQGRYLLDVLRLSISAFGKDGLSHDAPVGAGVLAGALRTGAGPEEPEDVTCSGPSASAAALLCPLKFGIQGLDALRAVVEIRVLRR